MVTTRDSWRRSVMAENTELKYTISTWTVKVAGLIRDASLYLNGLYGFPLKLMLVRVLKIDH